MASPVLGVVGVERLAGVHGVERLGSLVSDGRLLPAGVTEPRVLRAEAEAFDRAVVPAGDAVRSREDAHQ